MARKRTTVFEDIMVTVSKAPWWVGIVLAVVAYFVLHAIASRPVMMPTTVAPGQVGEAVSKGLIKRLKSILEKKGK